MKEEVKQSITSARNNNFSSVRLLCNEMRSIDSVLFINGLKNESIKRECSLFNAHAIQVKICDV
jgi:hypothetical protein